MFPKLRRNKALKISCEPYWETILFWCKSPQHVTINYQRFLFWVKQFPWRICEPFLYMECLFFLCETDQLIAGFLCNISNMVCNQCGFYTSLQRLLQQIGTIVFKSLILISYKKKRKQLIPLRPLHKNLKVLSRSYDHFVLYLCIIEST